MHFGESRRKSGVPFSTWACPRAAVASPRRLPSSAQTWCIPSTLMSKAGTSFFSACKRVPERRSGPECALIWAERIEPTNLNYARQQNGKDHEQYQNPALQVSLLNFHIRTTIQIPSGLSTRVPLVLSSPPKASILNPHLSSASSKQAKR